MFEQYAGVYGVVWWVLASLAVWLLYRIMTILKAIHFMLNKWFERDYIEPFEREIDND